MSRISFLASMAALLIALPADAGGLFSKKGKSDLRVRQLIDTLRTDADAEKRRSAIAELREADPRTQLDVIPALVSALIRDRVAEVRADAAGAIGQFKLVNPVAGLALENAAESDSSPLVRGAAQQALWEYHLNGYRSARGADGIAGQTQEPPLARPAVRPAAAEVVVQSFPVKVTAPTPISTPPRLVSLPALPLEPPATMTSYRLPDEPNGYYPAGFRVLLTAAPPLQLNVTTEPPFAKATGSSSDTPLWVPTLAMPPGN